MSNDEYEKLVRDFRAAKRVQLNFAHVPEPLKEAFAEGAKARGMGLKEYLVHLMREDGLKVPAYSDLDGRVNR